MKTKILLLASAVTVLVGACEQPNATDATGGASQAAERPTLEQAYPTATQSPPQDETRQASEHSMNAKTDSRARRSQPQAYLPTESRFLRNKNVSGTAVNGLLKAENFQDVVLQFETDQGRDPAAQDIAALYSSTIKELLPEGARLTNLSCGTSLCIGSINANGDNSAFASWEQQFANSKATPTYTYASITFDRGRGNFENRFFFSTDPGSDTVIVPPAPAEPAPSAR